MANVSTRQQAKDETWYKQCDKVIASKKLSLSSWFYCPTCRNQSPQAYVNVGDHWTFGDSPYIKQYVKQLGLFEAKKRKTKPELLCGRTTQCIMCETTWCHHVAFKGLPGQETMTALLPKK